VGISTKLAVAALHLVQMFLVFWFPQWRHGRHCLKMCNNTASALAWLSLPVVPVKKKKKKKKNHYQFEEKNILKHEILISHTKNSLYSI